MKQYIGLEEMSNGNCASVLDVIRNCGALSRRQISDITGLSWGGMTKIVNRLTEHEYIIEEESGNGTGAGRAPGLLKINPAKYYVIGMDINRAGFSAYVMNLCGEKIRAYEREVSIATRESLLTNIFDFAEMIMEDFRDRRLLAIGVAMQGVVDAKQGISVSFPHCPDWGNVPIRQMMTERFGVDVLIEHDPNCMLYTYLSREDAENMLLFRVDNSIGMAASVEGRILQGSGILEIAHHIVSFHGDAFGMKKEKSLENYISPCLNKGKLVKDALPAMTDALALAMYNMQKLFNAEKIIVTGHLAKYRAVFEDALCGKFHGLMQDRTVQIQIMEEAGQAVQGAALIAVQGAIDGLRL